MQDRKYMTCYKADSSYIKSKVKFQMTRELTVLLTFFHVLKMCPFDSQLSTRVIRLSSLSIQLRLKVPDSSLLNNFQLWLIDIICMRLPTESVFQSLFLCRERSKYTGSILKMSKQVKQLKREYCKNWTLGSFIQ